MCVIDFKQKIETCQNTGEERHVKRHVTTIFPSNWVGQKEDTDKFSVDKDAPEYKSIRALFDKTMSGKYTGIVRIDRIQNKQWYTQYNSYKSFSSQQDTERQLFHGCPQSSAKLIIRSFFNRSFAGANGLFNSLNNFSVK